MIAPMEAQGYVVVANAIPANVIRDSTCGLEAALAQVPEADGAIRREGGQLTAARNLIDLFPPCRDLWRVPALTDLLAEVLGPKAGLVRALYFDKPPERTWALPWHQDLSIAVKAHRAVPGFSKPTTKAGVPHLEAPADLLHRMLFLRIHLDAMTPDNGPLRVLPGSHRHGVGMTWNEAGAETILCEAGDVLAIRPLVVHSSIASTPGCTSHRRILHLEFAAEPDLPGGLEWRWWIATRA